MTAIFIEESNQFLEGGSSYAYGYELQGNTDYQKNRSRQMNNRGRIMRLAHREQGRTLVSDTNTSR